MRTINLALKLILIIISGITFMAFWGCECYECGDCDDCWWCDDTPPPVPYNVHSVTRDEMVSLYWTPLSYCDLEGYRIYRGSEPTGYYDFIGETYSACFNDYSACNGVTYYYAISSFDDNGNESELSYDLIYDTPRPEGYGVVLWDTDGYPNDAGYDFSEYIVREWDYPSTDIYLVYESGTFYIYPGNSMTDLLSYGYISSLDEIDIAPEDGWVRSRIPVSSGYGYCVWTCDNHFAKIRVTRTDSPDYIRFDWAYQTDTGNPELKYGEKRISIHENQESTPGTMNPENNNDK
ncbi:hypothetical protein JXI42_14875 [bacterium]|nr:hypothetical protein [bacterium]